MLQEDCNYNSAELSEGSTYYVLTCGGPGIPQVTVHRSGDHARLMLLEDNQDVSLLLFCFVVLFAQFSIIVSRV